jgi:cell division septum initiation protein DivIVA
MDLLAAIKREERKLEKELAKLQEKLSGLRAATKALGSRTSQRVTEVKKRVMSAAARAKISKATKARWAKFRAAKNKKALAVRGGSRFFRMAESIAKIPAIPLGSES